MAREIRRWGPLFLTIGALIALALFLVPTPKRVEAATYSNPHWSNSSSSPACAGCPCPPCPRPSEYASVKDDEPYLCGVGWRTGSLVAYFPMIDSVQETGNLEFGIRWDGDISGATQVGNSCVLSFEHTVEYEELNPNDPDGNGGHEVCWRRPDGLIVTYDWDGTDYSTTDCSVRHDLTTNGSGNYVLTDQFGNEMVFDSNGMPDAYNDRNGNALDFTYNSSYQITGLTDTRGKTYSFSHNADGFLEVHPGCRRQPVGSWLRHERQPDHDRHAEHDAPDERYYVHAELRRLRSPDEHR